jgi:transposase-like protein
MVGARRFERAAQRVDHRNGTYLRWLMTSMGTVELTVPRSRAGGAAGAEVLGRYRRRTQDVDDAIVTAYVHGASTRDMGKITEALMGEQVGRSTVSRVTKSLGEKVEELRKAPIVGPIPSLFLDTTFLDARWARKVVEQLTHPRPKDAFDLYRTAAKAALCDQVRCVKVGLLGADVVELRREAPALGANEALEERAG